MDALPSLSVCAIVKGPMREPEQIPVFAHQEGDLSIIETHAGELDSLVRALGRISKKVTLSLLINSGGGLDKARFPISRAMRRLQENGHDLWAFGQDMMASNAGWLFGHATNRIGIVGSDMMLHQTYLKEKTAGGEYVAIHPVVFPAHPAVFRVRLLEWIEAIPRPDARVQARARANEIFAGSNPLDEFWTTVEELDSWGMMRAVVPDEEALRREFLEACPFPEDLLPPSVRSFFGCD